jgi:hypothetical protein
MPVRSFDRNIFWRQCRELETFEDFFAHRIPAAIAGEARPALAKPVSMPSWIRNSSTGHIWEKRDELESRRRADSRPLVFMEDPAGEFSGVSTLRDCFDALGDATNLDGWAVSARTLMIPARPVALISGRGVRREHTTPTGSMLAVELRDVISRSISFWPGCRFHQLKRSSTCIAFNKSFVIGQFLPHWREYRAARKLKNSESKGICEVFSAFCVAEAMLALDKSGLGDCTPGVFEVRGYFPRYPDRGHSMVLLMITDDANDWDFYFLEPQTETLNKVTPSLAIRSDVRDLLD